MTDVVTIYALIDPRDQSVRYIGKANDPAKRLASHMRDSARRDTPVYRWVRKLSRIGQMPLVETVVECSSAEWPAVEAATIAKFRKAGVRLLNVADGGDQPFCPAVVRAENGRRSAAGRNHEKWRLMRSLGQLLKEGHVSEATKEKMRGRPDVFGKFAAHL